MIVILALNVIHTHILFVVYFHQFNINLHTSFNSNSHKLFSVQNCPIKLIVPYQVVSGSNKSSKLNDLIKNFYISFLNFVWYSFLSREFTPDGILSSFYSYVHPHVRTYVSPNYFFRFLFLWNHHVGSS